MTTIKRRRSYLKNGLIVLHIAFAFIGFFIYLTNYKLSESLLLQKTQARQLILAKSGSTSVENLLKNVQNQLDALIFSFTPVNDESPIDKNLTRAGFVRYMQKAQLPVNGIAYYDEKGTLAVIENRQHIRIGENEDFSRASFIQWSKDPLNKNKTLISTPYLGTTGASIGKIIIIVAKPIYFGNTYKGTLAIRLLVNDFTTSFVSSLSSDKYENTFIIDTNGVVVAGPNSLLNQNLFIYAKKQKWTGYNSFITSLQNALHTKTTQTEWIFQNPQERATVSIVGVSKIDIPDTSKDLYMVVSRSKESTLASLTPLRAYGLVWLGFGVLLTFLVGVIIISLSASD